jgi:hypothetical protein
MQHKATLVWSKPFSFEELLTDKDLQVEYGCAGVYLWMEPDPNAERIFYIGKTEGKPTLWARQMQHYAYYAGGVYHIPAKYRVAGEDWIPNIFPKNAEYVLDEEKMTSLVKEGMRFAKQLTIYFATVDDADKKKIKTIERELLYALKPSGTKWGTNTPPGTRIEILHKNATWYRPEFVPPNQEINLLD